MWFEPFWCTPFYSALIKCNLNPADMHFVYSALTRCDLNHADMHCFTVQCTDKVWFEPADMHCFTVHWSSVIWTLLTRNVLQCTDKCDLNPADMYSVSQCTGKYDLNLSDALFYSALIKCDLNPARTFLMHFLTVHWSSVILTLQIHTPFYNALSKFDLKHAGLLLQFLWLNTCWGYRRHCARCQSGT